jgi:hypothetical protein
MMVIVGVMAGAKHLSHLAVLRGAHVLRSIFEWDRFPADSTVGRLFRLFTPKHCAELAEVETAARRKVWGHKWFQRLTMDFDSTVRGVFGRQEGAAKGVNPKKKGQKSSHPLLGFVAETRECLHHWFRCGTVYSANGCAAFLQECVARLPRRYGRLFARGDSAFFDGTLLDSLETYQALYVIKAACKGLTALLAKQVWQPLTHQPGWEVCELLYRCGGGSMPAGLWRSVVRLKRSSTWAC